MDFNLLVLMSFEVTTATAMELVCCYNSHLLFNKVRANMQLPYEACFGGTELDRGWDQLMYGSLTLLRAASRCS